MDDNTLRNHLRRHRFLTFHQLDEVIRRQALLKGQGDFVSLGELVVEHQYLTENKLARVMEEIREQENLLAKSETKEPLPEEAERSTADLVSTEFGNFIIEEKVGQGGMGTIYRARQKDLKRVVALKVLRQDLEDTSEQLRRFRREAEAVAKLNHPNIISIFEIGHHDGIPFFSMEYIEGYSLEDLLRRGDLDLREGLEIVEAMARALSYAHSRGVIHRDIKPSNILIGRDKVPKLTDFGLAKNLDSHSLITHTGEIVGTVSYMSPEQAMGNSRDMDGRSDIYSLGIILYEICAHRLPFQGETTVEILRKIAEEEPIPIRRIRKEVNRQVETIAFKALEKDPNLRYQYAEAMADDIRRFLEGEEIQARPVTFLGRVRRRMEKYKGLVAIAALVVVLVLGLLIERHLSQLRLAKIQRENERKILQTQRERLAFEAILSLERQQPSSALHSLERALEGEAGGTPRLFYLRGKARAQLGEKKEAIGDFTHALELNPRFREALFSRAETYRDLKDYQSSLDDYTQFIEFNPEFPHARSSRGEVLTTIGDYSAAVDDLDMAIRLNPSYPRNYFLRGKAYMGWKRYDRALADFYQTLKRGEKSPTVYFAIGQCLVKLGEYGRARKIYYKVTKSARPSLQRKAYLELARLLFVEGDYWEGIECLDQVLEKREKDSQALRLKAQCLLYLGEFKRSRLTLEKLEKNKGDFTFEDDGDLTRLQVFLDRTHLGIRRLLTYKNNRGKLLAARLLIWEEKYREARAILGDLLKRDSNLATAYGLRGLIKMKERRYYPAQQDFTRAINLGSREPFVYSLRGKCRLNFNSREKARSDFEKADQLSLQAGTPWTRFFDKGIEAERKLLPHRAVKMYRYALFLNPGFSRAYYRMARCISRTWRGIQVGKSVQQKAIHYYRETLNHHPFFFSAYVELTDLYLQMGKPQRAVRALKRALDLGGSSPDLFYQLGLSHWHLKKFDEAQKNFLLALKHADEAESYYESYQYLARIADQKGREKDKKRYANLYQKFSQREKLVFSRLIKRARQAREEGQLNRSLELCNKILNQYPRAHQAYLLRAKLRYRILFEPDYQVLGESPPPRSARRRKITRQIIRIGLDYSYACEIEPSHFSIFFDSDYNRLVRTLYQIFSREEIDKFFFRPLASFPEEGEIHFLKALFYFYLVELAMTEEAEIDRALKSLRRTLRIKPEFACAWSLRGYFYGLKGKKKKAEFCFKRAAALEPSLGENYYFMACYYSRQGDIKKALRLVHQALDNGFGDYQRLADHPHLKSLRQSPDWKVIERRLGLR